MVKKEILKNLNFMVVENGESRKHNLQRVEKLQTSEDMICHVHRTLISLTFIKNDQHLIAMIT